MLENVEATKQIAAALAIAIGAAAPALAIGMLASKAMEAILSLIHI